MPHIFLISTNKRPYGSRLLCDVISQDHLFLSIEAVNLKCYSFPTFRFPTDNILIFDSFHDSTIIMKNLLLYSSSWWNVYMLLWCLSQMSCLGVEACVDGDPTRFALTSRGADGNTIRFVLQSSSMDISRSWVSDVNQILETQRNFLNGEPSSPPPPSVCFKATELWTHLENWIKEWDLVSEAIYKVLFRILMEKIINTMHAHTGSRLKGLFSPTK